LRGRFRLILCRPQNFLTYIASIMLVTPTVFIPQVLWTLSPEIGKAMGIVEPVKANIVLAIGYCSVMLGDIAASALSEWLQSRKKATLISLLLGIAIFTLFILCKPNTLTQFYAFNALLGLTFGIWVVGGAWAAEQFGTNIRATVTTTIPSFCRATAIPMNLAFRQLKMMSPLTAITVIGSVVFLLSSLSWLVLKETYGKNLDYLEGQ
jgi:putative MFS transporter